MTSRKTQQEIDKTFKKVAEGIQAFEGIYEKIRSANNPAQRDKLEDNLKREIKKLQRFRDQIKSWAAGNEVKDKSPLLEQRRAIETVGNDLTYRSCNYILPHPARTIFSKGKKANGMILICSVWSSSRPWRRR